MRVVRVTEVEECDPEKGRPTFSGYVVYSADVYVMNEEYLAWGYWDQITEIMERHEEVCA